MKRPLSPRGLCLLLPALIACGASAPVNPSSRVYGNVAGATLAVTQTSVYTPAQLSTPNGAVNGLGAIVVLSDSMGPLGANVRCIKLGQDPNPTEFPSLTLTLEQADDYNEGIPPTVGDYTIIVPDPAAPTTARRMAKALFDAIGPSKVKFGAWATSGTIHLSSLSFGAGGGAQGTFDLRFASDHLMGSFDAVACGAK
jgi:hypothetical protein